ncbi:DUF692 domain-containing protein [Luteibacter sp. E-22]|uniref:DUF692 domain-containing protein n=1 Tax=Luteibacter sp. E-22 TaxID=3404050 RepID=UPI003CF5206D
MNGHGRGLGLRREFARRLARGPVRSDIDFLEVVPDNWMGLGGESAEVMEALASRYPMVAHGLSLSIGDTQPLDWAYLNSIKGFLDRYGIQTYSDHMSMSRDSRGYLYELVPVTRTEASLHWMVEKIQTVQEFLSRQLALENVSYYVDDDGEIGEAEFLARLVDASGCALLLDINNVHVNSRNHGWDAAEFLDALPADAVAYYHVAGHLDQGPDDQVLDTHGAPVSIAVMELGARAVARFGRRPVVLERDNHVPSLDDLCRELGTVHQAMLEARGAWA